MARADLTITGPSREHWRDGLAGTVTAPFLESTFIDQNNLSPLALRLCGAH
jgi:hypothetical protein